MVKAGYRGASAEASGKEILTLGAIIIGVILVIYFLLRKTADDTVKGVTDMAGNALQGLSNITGTAVKTVSDTAGAIVNAPANYYQEENQDVSNKITEAVGVNNQGQTYDAWLTSQNDIIEGVVRIGNTITPDAVLTGSAQAGAWTRQQYDNTMGFFTNLWK